MNWKEILLMIFVIITVGFLAVYWFYPVDGFQNLTGFGHSNFSVDLTGASSMQFYDNMRYPETEISYRIDDSCDLQRRDNAKGALDIIAEKTVLTFNHVVSNEEIHISCDNKNLVQGGLFVAGEGGPTNITKAGDFNVITKGEVLLLKESECPTPNIATHEVLHALGFDHSVNAQNIMYNISNCKQTIGDDIPETINELYSLPTQVDLTFEEVTYDLTNRYISLNMSVRNNGFKKSSPAEIVIYVDGSEIKRIDLQSLDIGEGMKMMLMNLLLKKITINEIKFEIVYSGEELDKANNIVVLN